MSDTDPKDPAQDPKDPPATDPQPNTDWKAEARKWEQRAKENSEAAKKLADLEEANKTEIQKATERAAAAEQRATQAEQTALKVRIAAEMNVPVEVLTGDDETSIKASAQKILDWANQGKKPAPKPQSLKSGSSSQEESGMTGKQKAAAALRQLRSSD